MLIYVRQNVQEQYETIGWYGTVGGVTWQSSMKARTGGTILVNGTVSLGCSIRRQVLLLVFRMLSAWYALLRRHRHISPVQSPEHNNA